MTALTPEKAAPIPAEDILGGFRPEPAIDTTIFVTSERVRFLVARATMPYSTADDVERSIREAIEDTVRVIKQHRADREARIRAEAAEDERDRLFELFRNDPVVHAYAIGKFVIEGAKEPRWRAKLRARARQGGNNG